MSPTAFLLNPPSLPGSTANRAGSAGMGASSEVAGSFVYPPHLLATAAAVLRSAGWQVSGLDAVWQQIGPDEALKRLPQADVLILPVSYATLAADRAFLNRLRERKPLLQIIAVGPALRYPQVAHAFTDLADLLLAGEPELALPAAARGLLRGEIPPGRIINPTTLAKDAYRPDGHIADLDRLPTPAWDLFQQDGQRYPFLTLLSSRGCPDGCLYCPYVAAQGAAYRSQSPRHIADEMSELRRRFRPARVMFRDPVFAHDRNRVLALCSELRHRQLDLPWSCESRPEHFDARLLRAMQAAGCHIIKLGLESADPEILAATGRVPDEQSGMDYVEHAFRIIRTCRELGILCRVFVMAGLPNQSLASVQRTAAALRAMRPARLHVMPYHWYPGIALPQSSAEDVDEQCAILQAAIQHPPSRWRRLLRRIAR